MSPVGFAGTNQSTNNSPVPAPSFKDANNVIIPTNATYDQNSQTKTGGFEFYGKQALSIANAIIGSNIISQCSFGMKLMSINLFWAGTIAYIASEINAGGKDQNNDQNQYQFKVDQSADELRKLKGGGDGDVQRQIIEKRLADEQRTSKFINDRIKWLKAVMAIYTAAAAAALMEEYSGITTGAATGTGVCTGIASSQAASECAGKKHYAACYAARYAKHMSSCTSSMPKGWRETLPNFYRADSVAIAQGSCVGLYGPACTTYLQSYLGLAYANCTPFAPESVVMGISLAKIITSAYSMAITSTSGNSISKNIVMLYNLLETFIPSLAKNIMPAYNYPIPRSATFGALAALVGMIISGLDERQQKIVNPNIMKLTLIRDEFVASTSETGRLKNDTTSVLQKKYELQPQEKFSATRPFSKASGRTSPYCVSSDNNKLDFTDKGCLKPLVISKVTIPSFRIPAAEVLNKTNEMGIEMVNEISHGNLDQAKGIAGQLGDMMASIQEAFTSSKNNVNNELKAEGLAPYDFDMNTKKELSRLNDEYKGLINQNEKLASIKNTDLGIGNPQEKHTDQSSNKNIAPVSDTASTSTTVTDIQKSGVVGINSPQEGLLTDGKRPRESDEVYTNETISSGIVSSENNLLNDDELTSRHIEDLKSAQLNGYTDLEERLKMFSHTQNGISPISDVSLFKLISHRYHKSRNKILDGNKMPVQQFQKKKPK